MLTLPMMYGTKGTDEVNSRNDLLLSTARIIQVQPVPYPRRQAILRQALLSPEKELKSSDGKTVQIIDKTGKKATSITLNEYLCSLQLNSSGGDPAGCEYSAELLSQLTSATFPAISSSQVSSVLSEIACSQNSSISGSNSLVQVIPPKEKDGPSSAPESALPSGMEKQMCQGSVWYRCLSCEYMCLDLEKAGSHPPRCPRTINKISCMGCNNSFKSSAMLKAHLLIDHGVSVNDHPIFISINLQQHEELSSMTLITSETPEPGNSVVSNNGSHESGEVPTLIVEEVERLPANVADELDCLPSTVEDSSDKTLPHPPDFALFDGVDKFFVDTSATNDKTTETSTKETMEITSPEKSSSVEPVKVEKTQMIRCEVEGCPAKLSTQSNMNYHRLCHSEGGWKCPECQSVVQTWPALTMHLWRRHSIDIELYSCDQCSYKTHSMSKLTNLHRRTHGSERPFLCDLCGKGFKTTKQLRKHKVIHRNKTKDSSSGLNGESAFICDTCGRTFASARLLRTHSVSVHQKVRPYLCPHCPHSASSRSSLKIHTRQHTGETPYSCDECEFRTTDHNSLRRHKMRHSGTKKYSCPLCPYSSIQASTYKTHLISKHPTTEGLLFSCEVCPFKTIKMDNFLSHVSFHSIQAPTNSPS